MNEEYEYKVLDHKLGRKEEWLIEFKDKKIPPMEELSKICEKISFLWQTSIITYPETGKVYYSGWID